MPPESYLHKLQVALDANATAYRRALQTNAPGQCWDFVILTAANEKQAQGYRQELALRHRAVGTAGAFFPAIQRSIVVPDPPGRRAGSGGATFAALKSLCQQFDLKLSDLDRLHVLLIHSGGASQRLPAYSPLGKIFAPLPLLRPDGQIATLFDHLYLTLAGLPERLGPGMLTTPGDALLLFDHRHVARPQPGCTAISMRADAEVGRGHGVFVADKSGRVTLTLQKVSVETMRVSGATDASDRILIDTGMIFYDAGGTKTLSQLAGVGNKGLSQGIQEKFPISIDLYDEMAAAMATSTQLKSFLKSPQPPALRKQLWKGLRTLPFHVMELDGEFLHLGTTLQFRDAMVGRDSSPAAELFQQNILAHSEWDLAAGRRVYHSVLLADGKSKGHIGHGSVIEHSIVRAPSLVGKGSVISQTMALSHPIDLDDERLLFQVPVRDREGKVRHVHVLCGVHDDFKGRFDEGKCKYLNAPITEWMNRHSIRPADLWPGVPKEKQTLWTAKLFVATDHRDAAALATKLARSGSTNSSAAREWRKSPRYSMAMMLEEADPVALIEHRENVSAYLQTTELIDMINRDESRPLDLMISRYSTAAAYKTCEDLLVRFASADTTDAWATMRQSRAFWSVAQLLQRPDHPAPHDSRKRIETMMTRSFEKIAQASEIGYKKAEGRAAWSLQRPRTQRKSPQRTPIGYEVEATSPVRLDLTGGWSDTPPYCFERGGEVMNVAIDLDGRPPVRAIVKATREPKILLESHDLGQRIELTPAEMNKPVDVHDPFALHKIALQINGLLDVKPTAKTGGMHVLTECRVPKGSGLGTSSILAATLLAALHRFAGRKPSNAELIEQTLLLEQRLSTGGGWQDQIGGIVGGVKSTVTKPGVPQHPIVERLKLSDAKLRAFQERLVVYFSGQQRLARDILRRVMGRWIAREPAVLLLLEELKQSAAALRVAMLNANWEAAAVEIARYWRIKKDLYPGSTTPAIDVLMLEMRNDCLASGIAGAGAGGFVYFLCKDAKQAGKLRAKLNAYSSRPGSMGGVYETQLNRDGLIVTTRRSTP